VVQQALYHVTSSYTDAYIESNQPFTATLTAETGYTIASVVVVMGGVDVTATAYDDSDNSITIASATGNIVITASAS
jgi:hypothetical protein